MECGRRAGRSDPHLIDRQDAASCYIRRARWRNLACSDLQSRGRPPASRGRSDKALNPNETGSGARTLGDDPDSLAPFGMTAPLALLSRSRPPARQTFLPFRPRQHAVSKTHRTRNASTSYGAPANSHRHWGDHDRSVPCERKSGRRGVRQGTRAHCPALPRRVGRSRRAPGARGLATRVGASMMGVYVCSSTKALLTSRRPLRNSRSVFGHRHRKVWRAIPIRQPPASAGTANLRMSKRRSSLPAWSSVSLRTLGTHGCARTRSRASPRSWRSRKWDR
jgi:hypothetical protein